MTGALSALLSAPAYLKACCADLWAHPGIRLLAGEALHPGGTALSARALRALQAPAGARVLDVGSGPGASRTVAASMGLRPVGVDLSPGWGDERRAGWFVAGDAERLPFADGAFSGAVFECVLSVIPDKPRALAEVRRVVAPGGSVAVADVTVEGALPEELANILGWIACAAGALSANGYGELLAEAGFPLRGREDHGDELALMIARARRRLALLHGAARSGLIDLGPAGVPHGLLELAQRLLAVAADATERRVIGYVLLVAG